MGPRGQLQNTLQHIVRASGREIADEGQADVCELIEVLLRKLNLAPSDAMEDDPLDTDSDGEDERAKKQRRAEQPGQGSADAPDDDEEWQTGLGAVGRKLARRGLLGKRTAQQLGGLAAAPGGKAGGKASAKGKGPKGKGKGFTSYSAAVQAPSPAFAAAAAMPTGGAPPAGMASGTVQPGAAAAPIGVPTGGNLTGGWPQLGAQAAAGGEPIQAVAYAEHQAQLRRGEGQL